MADEIKLEMLPKELQERLKKALESGYYMITVSYIDDLKDDDLQHYWYTQRYPKAEMIPSMEHMIGDMKKEGKTRQHTVNH